MFIVATLLPKRVLKEKLIRFQSRLAELVPQCWNPLPPSLDIPLQLIPQNARRGANETVRHLTKLFRKVLW